MAADQAIPARFRAAELRQVCYQVKAAARLPEMTSELHASARYDAAISGWPCPGTRRQPVTGLRRAWLQLVAVPGLPASSAAPRPSSQPVSGPLGAGTAAVICVGISPLRKAINMRDSHGVLPRRSARRCRLSVWGRTCPCSGTSGSGRCERGDGRSVHTGGGPAWRDRNWWPHASLLARLVRKLHTVRHQAVGVADTGAGEACWLLRFRGCAR